MEAELRRMQGYGGSGAMRRGYCGGGAMMGAGL